MLLKPWRELDYLEAPSIRCIWVTFWSPARLARSYPWIGSTLFSRRNRPSSRPRRPRREWNDCACCRLALAGEPQYEVDSQELSGAGFLLRRYCPRLCARFPGAELFYLIGADHVAQLPLWREAAALAQLVTFVVIPRPESRPGRTASRTTLEDPKQCCGPCLSTIGRKNARDQMAVPNSDFARFSAGLVLLPNSAAGAGGIIDRDAGCRRAVAEAIRNNRLYLSAGSAQR